MGQKGNHLHGHHRERFSPNWGHGEVQELQFFRNDAELRAWMSVFQKTDRILTGRRDVSVYAGTLSDQMRANTNSLGWTDGRAIYINKEKFQKDLLRQKGKVRDRALATFMGVNYHEVSHTLFTPAMDSPLAQRVIQKNTETGDSLWWWCFNALEDQRAETLFWGLYPEAERFFKVMILDAIIETNINREKTLSGIYPLIYGRRYLPSDVRKDIGRAFTRENGVGVRNEVRAVIDEYVVTATNLTENTTDSFDLVERLYLALSQSRPEQDAGLRKGGLVSVHFDPPLGDAESLRRNDVASEALAKQGSQTHAPGGITRSKPDRAEVNNAIDRVKSSQSLDSEDDGDEEGDGNESSPGNGAGNQPANDNSTDMYTEDSRSLERLLREETEQAIEKVADDLNDQIEAAKEALESGAGLVKANKVSTRDNIPSDSANRANRDITELFRELRADLEAEWHRNQPQGRLNAHRASIIDLTLDLDVFDSFEDGIESEGGFELVVLIDRSGSMAGPPIDHASEMGWVLKRMSDSFGEPCTVMVYSFGDADSLYGQTESASFTTYKLVGANGGTDPTGAIKMATGILDASDKRHKILVNLTDGQWAMNPMQTALIKHLRTKGVITLLVGLNRAVWLNGDHGHEFYGDVNDPLDVIPIVKTMIGSIMATAVNEHRD